MHVCMYVCMYVCVYLCMHVCMYVCMHVCIISLYIYIYIYIYIYVCVCVCVYTYTHTHTKYNCIIKPLTTFPYGQGLLVIEASRSHPDTRHSILLWTSDQPDIETYTLRHTTLTRDRHSCPRRDSNPQSQQASGGTPTALTTLSSGTASLSI